MKNIKQKGFTLIELLIVMVILGILAVAVAPKFLDFSSDAKQATASGVEGALKAAAQLGIAEIAMGSSSAAKASSFPDSTVNGIGAYFEADGLDVVGVAANTTAVDGKYQVIVQADGASATTDSCIVTYELTDYVAAAGTGNNATPATATDYTVTSSEGCTK